MLLVNKYVINAKKSGLDTKKCVSNVKKYAPKFAKLMVIIFAGFVKKKLNPDFGKIVCEEWVKSFEIRRELVQDEFVVMQNHFHGIMRLVKIVDQFDVGVYENVNVVKNVNVVETSGRTSLPCRCPV